LFHTKSFIIIVITIKGGNEKDPKTNVFHHQTKKNMVENQEECTSGETVLI